MARFSSLEFRVGILKSEKQLIIYTCIWRQKLKKNQIGRNQDRRGQEICLFDLFMYFLWISSRAENVKALFVVQVIVSLSPRPRNKDCLSALCLMT